MSKIKKFKITKYKKEIKPILQMKNISKRYGKQNVLQDLNMNIMPSSITGLLGPNGSGKTTIFNILLGIIKMDAGELFINHDGKKILTLDRCQSIKDAPKIKLNLSLNMILCLETCLWSITLKPSLKLF